MNERTHLSAMSLDRLLLGSMPAAEEQQSRAHLEACASCRQALEENRAARQHFEARLFARTLPAVEARLQRPGLLARLGSLLRSPKLLAPAGALALALLLLVPRPATDADLRIKGGPIFQLFALRQDSVLKVRPETRLAAGDRIRFVVEAPKAGFLLVASVDGAGKVSLYFPPEGAQSAAVGAGRTELPGSIELDDAPGPERLFAYFSDAPLPADEVTRALAAEPGAPVAGVVPLEASFGKERR